MKLRKNCFSNPFAGPRCKVYVDRSSFTAPQVPRRLGIRMMVMGYLRSGIDHLGEHLFAMAVIDVES